MREESDRALGKNPTNAENVQKYHKKRSQSKKVIFLHFLKF